MQSWDNLGTLRHHPEQHIKTDVNEIMYADEVVKLIMTISLTFVTFVMYFWVVQKTKNFWLTEQRLGFDGGIAPWSYATFSDVHSTRYAENVSFPTL